MDRKTKTDKVCLCESVVKIKVVVQLAKTKMNELSIRIIYYLQIHVHHLGIPKVPIRGLNRIYDIALQDLPGNPPFFFQWPQESEKSVSFKIWREVGGQTEVFQCNVWILLHSRLNLFRGEWSREADEGVSAWGRFLHRPRCFGVNDIKGNNQLDETKQVLTSMVSSPQWTSGWDSLRRPSCW